MLGRAMMGTMVAVALMAPSAQAMGLLDGTGRVKAAAKREAVSLAKDTGNRAWRYRLTNCESVHGGVAVRCTVGVHAWGRHAVDCTGTGTATDGQRRAVLSIRCKARR